MITSLKLVLTRRILPCWIAFAVPRDANRLLEVRESGVVGGVLSSSEPVHCDDDQQGKLCLWAQGWQECYGGDTTEEACLALQIKSPWLGSSGFLMMNLRLGVFC